MIQKLLFITISAKEKFSKEVGSHRSKRDTTSLIFGGQTVRNLDKKRKYPWAGAFFYRQEFKCGGNLSKY
jgi:hypothetical protein